MLSALVMNMRISRLGINTGLQLLIKHNIFSSSAMQALKIGDSASTSKMITKQDVQDFASLTLDTNPLHVDEVYAQGTRFKQPIVHGMFSLSLVASILGIKMPGLGSVFLGMNDIRFTAPVYINEEVTAMATITNIEKRVVTFDIECKVQQADRVVLTGVAKVLAPSHTVR